jgi:hypothetical protein
LKIRAVVLIVSAFFDAHSRWVGETAMNRERVSNNRFLVLFNNALTMSSAARIEQSSLKKAGDFCR